MRRRFLGGQKQQQQSSAPAAKAKGGLFRKAAASPQPPSAPGIDTTAGQVAINRRSFTAVDGPIGGGRTVAAAADYSLFLAENKYATIGGPGARSKWPLRGGTSEKALNGVGRPCPAGTGRPRSMGAAQMGVKTAETAFGAADLPPPPQPAHANQLQMSGKQQQQLPNGGGHMSPAMFQVVAGSSGCGNQANNNRNSTGSTNSSQTSSGFESGKSNSSQQLAQSTSSGSCSLSSAAQPGPLPQSSCSPVDPASPSSRLSSAGSSTQGGRSSAYFSLSDGLDCGGTLTAQPRSARGKGQGLCARVNIGEMLAKGIPEPEIFAEWLQRLCLPEYLALFLAQGYDLPTLARATPEDLTTLGITRPEDRKRLVQDIQCWRNVSDNWPTAMPREASVRDWLAAIGLKQYVEQFEQQGYLSVGELQQLEAEDLEDLGVRKLGHIKRIWLALKKLKQAETARAMSEATAPTSILTTATLRPCNLATASTSSCTGTLRRHSQPQQQQQQQQQQQTPPMPRLPLTSAVASDMPRLREAQPGIAHVQFRNSSFGVGDDPAMVDKGPPRLNLYRTSQIIAQLPREPPPDLLDEEEESGIFYGRGHIPPPPAPMPLSPILPCSSASRTICPPPFGSGSLSQPATPRNVQRMFAVDCQAFPSFQPQPAPGRQQQQLEQLMQGLGNDLGLRQQSRGILRR